jgi:hypothetical protein
MGPKENVKPMMSTVCHLSGCEKLIYPAYGICLYFLLTASKLSKKCRSVVPERQRDRTGTKACAPLFAACAPLFAAACSIRAVPAWR